MENGVHPKMLVDKKEEMSAIISFEVSASGATFPSASASLMFSVLVSRSQPLLLTKRGSGFR